MATFKIEEWEFNKPYWSKISNCGLYKVPQGKGEKDYHYHDCDEYFIVTEGKGKLLLEGKEYEIVSRDCVCIPIGGKHQILKALEDLTYVCIYDELKGKKRKGHILSQERDKCILPVKLIKMGHWRKGKPDWSRLTDYGIINFPIGKVEMDYHYHDCHEYYFVTKGSLLTLVDGKEQKMEEGYVCPIRIGDEHKILEAYEDTTLVWVQDELLREKRYGHLHYKSIFF